MFLVIGFLTFESCHAFYRPMHSFIEKTLDKILQDQLERRFGKLPVLSTTQTTTTVETTTRSPSIATTLQPKNIKVKICEFKAFEACSLEEWITFLKHVLKNQRHWKLPRNHFEDERKKDNAKKMKNEDMHKYLFLKKM